MTCPDHSSDSWETIDHPLFQRLISFNVEIAQQFPDSWDPGLGSLGLMLDRHPDASRYESSTPMNCRTFGCTGGEGVHFSFLLVEDSIRVDSPIVVTIPVMFTNFVVGENLHDFLSLCSHRGFFALEQLAYKLDLTLNVYTNSNWQPSASSHRGVGYVTDEIDRQVLNFMREEFALSPWPNSARFHDLQTRYGALLQLPDADRFS